MTTPSRGQGCGGTPNGSREILKSRLNVHTRTLTHTCRGHMSWAHVVGTYRGHMSWVHVVRTCRGHLSWVHVSYLATVASTVCRESGHSFLSLPGKKVVQAFNTFDCVIFDSSCTDCNIRHILFGYKSAADRACCFHKDCTAAMFRMFSLQGAFRC